ncbi:MAG: malonyl-CoA decarboxylase [Pseudomonadota bacterium]|nr:malonyl-CoA decarboxylase [Pseudomonadota bacterium]
MGRISMSQFIDAIADLGRHYFERPSRKTPLKAAKLLCDDLLSDRGEASGTALARDLVERYLAMNDKDQNGFIDLLAADYGYAADKLQNAASAYVRNPADETYQGLRDAVESPRRELLRRINMAPDGTATIIKIRERVLNRVAGAMELNPLETDLRDLLDSWFNRGFLQFERIEWQTPAAILEKLIAYEAVHEIRGWDDLRRRLAEDRRCFAFFHPALHDEPLIFVEVALTNELSGQIAPLLDSPPNDNPPDPTTAIFYSISNCQTGLAGISFGNFLIKQVVDDLSEELPTVKTFSTLSPIPGFRDWLRSKLLEKSPEFVTEEESTALAESKTLENGQMRSGRKKLITRLCATYLTSINSRGLPLDPVARFHLGNGASIERVNWDGDLSQKGINQSAGLMVNYLYDSDQIVANHEAFASNGKIATSAKVRAML